MVTLLCTTNLFSQEKINLSAGFGVPEFMNVGILYQLNQVQVGVSTGLMMHNMSNFNSSNGDNAFSFSGDLYYHFAGKPVAFSNRKPWYGKIGVNFLKFNESDQNNSATYLNFRIGRDFYFSEKLGVAIGVGAAYQLNYIKNEPSLLGEWFNLNFNSAIVPSVGMRFFLRT
tara:strand:- start:130 stop:642 length:513 start_codon:yes stop_codon:yes gene_type:complete